MDEPIVSQDHARRKAQQAFEAGEHFKDCPYNPGSVARKVWQEEFRRLIKGEEKVAA